MSLRLGLKNFVRFVTPWVGVILWKPETVLSLVKTLINQTLKTKESLTWKVWVPCQNMEYDFSSQSCKKTHVSIPLWQHPIKCFIIYQSFWTLASIGRLPVKPLPAVQFPFCILWIFILKSLLSSPQLLYHYIISSGYSWVALFLSCSAEANSFTIPRGECGYLPLLFGQTPEMDRVKMNMTNWIFSYPRHGSSWQRPWGIK